ncbi:MAG TPA: putative O-glycosylation ligase, exosortase A system-associated [Casimicrobiaceae bacterium]|nr:putative O-glycosylation ligase, exosortase A system-associated [Casimicrobiaceae bacterium]
MRDYALTMLIIGLLPICVWRPWIGIVVWYWFGLMNPHRLTWDFAYTMPFALWIGVATLAGILFARDRKPIPWNSGLVLLLLLVVYFTFTTFFAWAPNAAWAQWNKVIKVVLMTFVATMFIYGKDRIYALMLTMALSIGFYGVKGFFFVLRTGGAGRVQGPEGSFIDGNTFLGMAFTMMLPVLVYLARDERRLWLKNLLYTVAAMTAVSTVFTYSRGAYLGLAAIAPLMLLRSRRKWLAVAVLVPLLAVAPSMLPDSVFKRAELIEHYEGDRSANQRLQSWAVAWNLALDRPLTGAGFNFEYGAAREQWLAYGSEKYAWALSHSSAAHSIYFQVLGQHGFVAFAMYLALLVGTLVSLNRLRAIGTQRPELEWISTYATGLQIGLVGYMVSGAFLSSAYFDLAILYYALAAILWREVRAAEGKERAVEPDRQGGSGGLPSRSAPAIAVPGGR